MYILAIETSCDETSAAIAKDRKILSNIISSQVELHKKYGGVVPILAKRAHEEKIDPVITEAFKRANQNNKKINKNKKVKEITLDSIDIVAVTHGPGLAPALEVGVAKAKELAIKHKKPLIAINHMDGHIHANFGEEEKKKPIPLPALCVLVSGKHTETLVMKNHGKYTKIGETLDDAIGEAFDKVARMLGLGYPGGKLIEEMAKHGSSTAYNLPIPLEYSPTCDFSYSGLKTATLYMLKKIQENKPELDRKIIEDMCASFERVAVAHLIQKTKRALKLHGKNIKSIILGGGVAANKKIRKELRSLANKNNLKFFYPDPKKLCTDNAGMIALAAYYKIKKQGRTPFGPTGSDLVFADPKKLERDPRAKLEA